MAIFMFIQFLPLFQLGNWPIKKTLNNKFTFPPPLLPPPLAILMRCHNHIFPATTLNKKNVFKVYHTYCNSSYIIRKLFVGRECLFTFSPSAGTMRPNEHYICSSIEF